MKDPNKPILRLYDIPDTTFESEEESGESEEGEELCELSGITWSVCPRVSQLLYYGEESQDTKSILATLDF